MGIFDRIVKATSDLTGQVASAGRDISRKITGTISEETVATDMEEIVIPETKTPEDPPRETVTYAEDASDNEIVFLTELSEEEAQDDVPSVPEEPEIKGTPVYGDPGLYSLENNFAVNRQRRRSWDD